MADINDETAYERNPNQWVQTHIDQVENTGEALNTPEGRPIIVPTFTGRRSHKTRKTALMKVEHDGSYALVASKGGAPQHPEWYHNLVVHPDIVLQDGSEKYDMRVRELTGDERAAWWDRAVEAYPPYADYQTKTDREIPVLLAEPVQAP